MQLPDGVLHDLKGDAAQKVIRDVPHDGILLATLQTRTASRFLFRRFHTFMHIVTSDKNF